MRPLTATRHKAVFLDKDGTLIDDVPFNVDPTQIALVPEAIAALRCLHEAGFTLCVISNQSGVALGFFQEKDLRAVSDEIGRQLGQASIPLAGFYYCPHHPEGRIASYSVACGCRKPQPGLLHKAADELAINLAESWFIGDILHDVEAGHRAGCRAVLIGNGNETEWDLSSSLRIPDLIASDLLEAAVHITQIGRDDP